jgi:hypothetical protein
LAAFKRHALRQPWAPDGEILIKLTGFFPIRFQVITGASLYRRGINEEGSIINHINALVEECSNYKASMLVFDMESLVLVEHDPALSLGDQSAPRYRVMRPMLLHYLINVMQSKCRNDPSEKLMCVAICTHPHITEKVRTQPWQLNLNLVFFGFILLTRSLQVFSFLFVF